MLSMANLELLTILALTIGLGIVWGLAMLWVFHSESDLGKILFGKDYDDNK